MALDMGIGSLPSSLGWLMMRVDRTSRVITTQEFPRTEHGQQTQLLGNDSAFMSKKPMQERRGRRAAGTGILAIPTGPLGRTRLSKHLAAAYLGRPLSVAGGVKCDTQSQICTLLARAGETGLGSGVHGVLLSQLAAASHTGLKHRNTLLKESDKESRSPALLEVQTMGLIINRLSEAYERHDGMPRERSSSDSHELMP
ncbi:hypothetical protein M430DRAFT_28388 [Amorphotheca resinae ATCC 22711]|uniref:Uncharacterized protein n=1 Tax=Amorphotheca resinae ATCC 22711 TaxID=857342 RepID=A0A2T3AZN8_AMORE|nr:hypothetical protein M430DRAFT_28388 [Amorphotheca resinae ATCC 22711]PSS16626.1 hypothetical protein M430DRAFT_28388 [Amorphotheca resinae ATCC 22711]